MTLSPMVTPELTRDKESRNYCKFSIGPLEKGYGVTLGNSLRRVLLSSLEGAAITSVRISDVLHEFSDIPGVREDVLQVILQMKNVKEHLLKDIANKANTAHHARRGYCPYAFGSKRRRSICGGRYSITF